MRRVTGLRAQGRERVAVEVDGERWRVFPAEVVVRAGLTSGVELERPLLRALRRELRRHQALAAATRALRARPLSARRLDERLRGAGFAAAERAEALATLCRAGFVDDERLSCSRAELLAERHGGDALIRHNLCSQGFDEETVARALASIEPEAARGARAAAARGGGLKAARYLARKGFSEDAIEAAIDAMPVAQEP